MSQRPLRINGWTKGHAASRNIEPPATNLQVQVFYLPREGLTAKPSARQAHKRFWRSDFDDRQAVFEDQTIMSNYPRGSACSAS